MHDDPELQRKFASILPNLDERQRRLLAAAEARSLGYGGIGRVSWASGISHTAIRRALKQLDAPPPPAGHVRRPGGGRKKVRDKDPAILSALEELIAPETRGDPMSPLRWTCKSTRQLAEALAQRGFAVSHRVGGELLHHLGYSLQANAKMREGKQSPDRDAQFRYISKTSGRYIAAGWPVISVDTKKKELIGDFKNAGREWQPQGHPEEVQVHDFPDPRVGKAIPSGVYDVAFNDGYVIIGTTHDTPDFAVAAIRRWWLDVGRHRYPQAKRLLIEVDSGGANDHRKWGWKVALQRLADEFGLTLTVTHYPPGASKWNPIEHRMFSPISENWTGEPLVSYETIMKYIRTTQTETGFHCRARLDRKDYPPERRATREEKAWVRLKRRPVQPELNYTIYPHRHGPNR